ncbi:DUF2397 family protein [Phytohabitans kaempferiae]|uniref:DUF2397 family protein n=1 Tax=Phytohabitans kaempferiae TaxID=1620943 RepID=A0ABV6MAD2_9ACTN
MQYSLTRKGEAAFEGCTARTPSALCHRRAADGRLDPIADRLDELYRLTGDSASDNRRIYAALSELEGHRQALRTNTIAFNGQLARLLRDEDLATFHEVKRATVAYLEEFITNLDQRKHTTAEATGWVERQGVTVLQHRALAGADLPLCLGSRIRRPAGWSNGRSGGKGGATGSYPGRRLLRNQRRARHLARP